jgi:hypothetical protein
MMWVDIDSLRLLTVSLYLSIFAVVIPESIVGLFAIGASVSTIVFNLVRFYESRKQKKHDRTTEKDK